MDTMTIEQAKAVMKWAERAGEADSAETRMRWRRVRSAEDVRREKQALRLAQAREHRAALAVERTGIVMPWGAGDRSALMCAADATLRAMAERAELAAVATPSGNA